MSSINKPKIEYLREAAYQAYIHSYIDNYISHSPITDLVPDSIHSFMDYIIENFDDKKPDPSFVNYISQYGYENSERFVSYHDFISDHYQSAEYMSNILTPEQFDFYKQHDSWFGIY